MADDKTTAKEARVPVKGLKKGTKNGTKGNLKEGLPAAKTKASATPVAPKAEKPTKEAKAGTFNPWTTLLYPHLAEKSMGMVEMQNRLTFIVHSRATKSQVREAVEKGFSVRVLHVNIQRTQKGLKKAFITLSKKDSAADIATRMGMI
ncbi:MAG: 50S ribosomal protein L23 [Candidatus Aenigmarchaeota archaeon]|nr:50S ribosomal protein L23 [Candidatus Aenigmarchaeota archaeon]